MTNVIQFPNKDAEEVDKETYLGILIYQWWMQDFYPMFEEGGKLLRSYMVYGEFFHTVLELYRMDMVEILEEDEKLGLGIQPEISHLIFEQMIAAFNACKLDSELNDEDKII